MDEGYIDFEEGARTEASIAEINLVNTISNMLKQLIEENRLIYVNVPKLVSMTPEDVDEVVRQVRSVKESIEDLKDKSMEYLARLPSEMIMKDVFGPIILKLNNVNQLMEGSFYRFALLGKKREATNSLVVITRELVGMVLDQLNVFSKALNVMNEYPKEALKEIRKIDELEEKIDVAYRSNLYEVLEESGSCPCAILTWEILGNIEDASDELKEAAENFKYYLLHRV